MSNGVKATLYVLTPITFMVVVCWIFGFVVMALTVTALIVAWLLICFIMIVKEGLDSRDRKLGPRSETPTIIHIKDPYPQSSPYQYTWITETETTYEMPENWKPGDPTAKAEDKP